MQVLFCNILYNLIQDVQFVLLTAQFWQGVEHAEHWFWLFKKYPLLQIEQDVVDVQYKQLEIQGWHIPELEIYPVLQTLQ